MVNESRGRNLNLRIPPQSVESERALLGATMLRGEAIYDIADIVSKDSFYVEKHRIIFQTIVELHSKKEPIDLLTLGARLLEHKQLENIGGRTYLAELVNSVPSSANIKYYAETVQRKAVLRRLIGTADYISELGYDEESDLDQLLDVVEKKIFDVTNTTASQKFTHLKDGLGEAWERLEKLHKSDDKIRGVPTGYRNLDNLLSGLQKSDFIILAARPSMGKTTLALDIARQAASLYNVPVGIFSLEMSAQQLVDRMLAAESRVDAWKLRTGQLRDEDDFLRIQEGLGRLSKAPIFIDDTPSNSILQMRSVARRLKREHGLGLLIIDYIQLIGTSRNYDSMVQQVTEISRALKALARELDVPVLALSQLSRAIEQRRDKPRLSDLRDSGSLEQDADVVMFIHREDKYKEEAERTNIASIIVEKHRNGPLGAVDLYFDDKKTTFMTLEKEEQVRKGNQIEEKRIPNGEESEEAF